MRTQRKLIIGTAMAFLGLIGMSAYFIFANKVVFFPKSNLFIKNISFYLSQVKEKDSQKTVIFNIDWQAEVDEKSVVVLENYLVEQVTPVKGKWVKPDWAKNVSIKLVQHVFPPLSDTKNKQEKSGGLTKKITQLNVVISPPPEVNDFYRVRVKNISFSSGTKMTKEEYGVTEFTKFHKFIKM